MKNSGIIILIVVLLLVVGGIFAASRQNKNSNNGENLNPLPTQSDQEEISIDMETSVPASNSAGIVSEDEKKKIDDWIKREGLNEYGDPSDTMYTGGTPLFNEMTGETLDKYQFIIENHPDKPWNK